MEVLFRQSGSYDPVVEVELSQSMATLRVNNGMPRIVFETTPSGEIVPSERAKSINVCVRSELVVERAELAFHTIVKIDKARTASEEEAEALAVAWLKSELPKRFSEPIYWNFFEHTELRPVELPEIGDVDVPRASSVDLDLSPTAQKIVTEALDHVAGARAKFESAKARLWSLANSNLPLGFAQTKGEAHALLRTIERILQAGADVGGYESYKARSAMRDYDELARRKVESNHNYRSALQSLKSFAYGVSFPSTWGRRPNG